MSDEAEKTNYLRERVSALEAVVGYHKEMLSEVRDAVSGINNSLRLLTNIEAQMLSVQESNVESRQRLIKVEEDLVTLKSNMSINTHERTRWERWWPVLVAAVLGPVVTVGLMFWWLN